MTETVIALRRLRDVAGLLAQRPPLLPMVSACRERADALPALIASASRPTQDVLEALRQDLLRGCTDQEAASLPMPLLRQAPLVLWQGEPQAATFPGLLDEVLHRAAGRTRLLHGLIEAWLRDLGQDRIGHQRAGRRIAALLLRARDPRLALWKQASESYALFDGQAGPGRLSAALLHGPHAVTDVLAQTGMNDPLRADGRFFRAAMAALLDALPDVMRGSRAGEAWTRAAALLEVARSRRDRTGREISEPSLRFSDLAGPMARACLGAWISGPVPVAAPKELVKPFLLRMLGDPRLQPASGWTAAGPAATALMRSWLAADSLEAFLALITQTKGDQQWRYRELFWRACLRKMPSAEVWVVLGPALSQRAKFTRDLANSHGYLDASGSDGSQAVLLMRLGNVVLSEWSNVGPVRAWIDGEQNCPKLYEKHYDASKLKAVCLPFPDHPLRGNGGSSDGRGLWHHGGSTGLWQGCAATLLASKTSLRLSERDYRP